MLLQEVNKVSILCSVTLSDRSVHTWRQNFLFLTKGKNYTAPFGSIDRPSVVPWIKQVVDKGQFEEGYLELFQTIFALETGLIRDAFISINQQ